MNDQQVHELAQICTRYADLRNASKQAASALNKFKTAVFSDTLTVREKDSIAHVSNILERIASETSQHDAIKYFNTLQTV